MDWQPKNKKKIGKNGIILSIKLHLRKSKIYLSLKFANADNSD
jgi:hypothetical protein